MHQAAQTLLDRVGISKRERLEVSHNHQGGIFLLPDKETITINAQEAEYEEINKSET